MIPAKLRPGDTIAVFSPSSPATATAAARYRRGKEYLEAKGFRFLEGSLTGRRDLPFRNDPGAGGGIQRVGPRPERSVHHGGHRWQ